jgi:hypothetical protein
MNAGMLASPRYAIVRAGARSADFQTRSYRLVAANSSPFSARTVAHVCALPYFSSPRPMRPAAS